MSPEARSRFIVAIACLAAALYLLSPSFAFNRSGQWRTVLAGFQLQKETGDFIGASESLIHFHGLDGQPGTVAFRLSPRIAGQGGEVDVTWGGGSKQVNIGASVTAVEVPFDGAKDLEIRINAIHPANPRPIVLSDLSLNRSFEATHLALALLPVILGWISLHLFRRCDESSNTAAGMASFVTLASAALTMAAFDPVRVLALPASVALAAPIVLTIGFAAVGIFSRSRLAIAVALAGATLSLHVHTVHAGFVYDDRNWSHAWTLAEVASTFVGSEDPNGLSGEQYRPIPSVTHAVDHVLWGSSPAAFHVVNMALHAISAFLLFVFLQRLRLPRGSAFLGALVLTIHPLAASSVGWISERTDTLADIFMLGTLIVFLGRNGAQTLRVLGVALLALWSKETSVMLPALAILVALIGLNSEERRERYSTVRALIAFVVLYVAVWISLFPDKAVRRATATADTFQSDDSGWIALFGNLFSQLFHPMGFEAWRGAQSSLPVSSWFGAVVLLAAVSLLASFVDRKREVAWRLVFAGLAFSALVVIPFRGHDAVDIYRLGHSPTVGFGLLVAAIACLPGKERRAVTMLAATLLIARFAPVSQETSAAWGYPGFQFRMALRFNIENPIFVNGVTAEMKQDLEREVRFEAHRDSPLAVPFEP